MSVLQVLHIPDERLRKVAKPVEEVNAEIQRIVDEAKQALKKVACRSLNNVL